MKKKIVITIAFIAFAALHTIKAQFVSERDGKPIVTNEYVDVEGSPYLSDNWGQGMVKLSNGKTFSGLELKYNLKEDVIYYKDSKSGNEFVFIDPVDEFTLTYIEIDDGNMYTKRFKRGFNGIIRTTPQSYFEVLSEGYATLLKRVTKDIIVSQNFNSATKTKLFKESSKSYYIVRTGKAEPVKNDKKSILSILADRQSELNIYLKSNNINFRSDADLAKLVTYYNSL